MGGNLKMRRSQPQVTSGDTTHVVGANTGPAQAGRRRPDRPGRLVGDASDDLTRGTKVISGEKSSLQAPSARTGPQVRDSAPHRKYDDDDDFGDHDVASMLA